ncbi:MAG: GNAT family N-acyltransferase [Paracoccaceae bacterium]
MNMSSEPLYRIAMAKGPDDIRAAQALRYKVFVQELGANGPLTDHNNQLEADHYDAFCDHMLLIDNTRDCVAGVYRLLTDQKADDAGGFYSETEYDLSMLKSSGRRLLELGRSCLAPEYRGGAAMYVLWHALGEYIAEHEIDLLFGVASFRGTDTGALAAPLSLLHHRHLAPDPLRPVAHGPTATSMNLLPEKDLDRRAAMIQIPALIKAYLRLGGVVGQGAWIDTAFNTTDVCLVLDTKQITPRQRQIYSSS